MVEIPNTTVASFIKTCAREWGERREIHDSAAEGEYGQHSMETDWSLTDFNPKSAEVEYVGDGKLVARDVIEATYSVQVARARRNPPGKAHPAEYEQRSIELIVSLEMDLSQPAPVFIDADIF